MLLRQSTLHKFVRFPRACAAKTVFIDVGRKAQLSISDIEWPTIVEEIDIYVLQNIVELSCDTISTRETSTHAMVCHSSNLEFFCASSGKYLVFVSFLKRRSTRIA